jgi:hypothetical protein
MQLGKTKAIKHSGGVVVYFRNHLSLKLVIMERRKPQLLSMATVSRGAAPYLFIYVV